MTPGFVHDIDPVIASVGGLYLWWYGTCFALGFATILVYVRATRRELGMSRLEAYDLALCVAIGVLLGGRLVEVAFYEWPFYREHPHLIPAYWLGGMSTHGLLVGGVAGAWVFGWIRRRSLVGTLDLLSVPAAFILAFGRIGNFIDGQIVGSVTDVWWAVKFPDAEGFRHPVVLYDGLKNLLLVPVLLLVARRRPPRGALAGSFLFLYASLRVLIDLFREYPTTLLGLATGQGLNLATALAGVLLLVWSTHRRAEAPSSAAARDDRASRAEEGSAAGLLWRRIVFAALLLSSTVIPGDWTQDVPERYGKRHPGMVHSAWYPRIDTAPAPPEAP